ncbi:MAG TPA: VWA domain-containing protein [Calditrichia bacterium]|nr:VWA domain-containing protein [Calditrichota bacterium]HQU71234.1 VWA domain-containing protein [Calditrichia bacterium]HQV32202.1 VWA domain-containing protein [Calditrichia bacterium]
MSSILRKTALLMLGMGLLFWWGCSEDGAGPNPNADIPSDPQNVTVPETAVNNLRPTATFAKTAENEDRIRMNLLGLLTGDGATFVPEYNAEDPQESNIFVLEDGTVKGLKITDGGSVNLPIDMVFTVDNSGSMGQEADSVAGGITEFAQFLSDQGFDIQFGCVGYDGYVSGAINLTDYEALNAFLNQRLLFPGGPPVTGINRTNGFTGADSATFDSLRYYYGTGGENGIAAIFFAEHHFSWRRNALRIYVNFTDEPSQPGLDYSWSTDTLCSVMPGRATIHTVWSNGDTTNFGTETPLRFEKPWRMSECTGGELRVFDRNATGLTLLDLPVTNVVSGSKLVEFVSSSPGGVHTLEIVVRNGDTDDGRTVYEGIEY